MANVKATDLIDFTRASKGHALAKVSYGANELPSASFTVVSNGTWDGTQFVDTVGSQVRPGVTSGTALTNGTTYALFINITDITGATQVRIDGLDGTDRLLGEGDHRISFISNGGTPRVRLEDTSTSVNDGFTLQTALTAKEVLFNQPDGTLQLFEHPNNIPRIEYDADGNLLGLLIEESRTNLISYSEFTGGWPGKTDISISTNAVTSPTGNLDAALVTSKGIDPYIFNFNTVTSGNDYVFTVWLKGVGDTVGKLPRVWMVNNSGTISSLVIDTTPLTSEWRRYTATGTCAVTGTVLVRVDFDDSGTSANGDQFHIYGAQFEQGSFPTSYIKTQGSTVSRAADVASIDVDQFGYNQSEGTLFASYHAFSGQGSTTRIAALNDGSTSNSIQMALLDAGTTYHEVRSAGTAVVTTVLAGAITDDALTKTALASSLNDHAGTTNGGTVGTDTSGAMPIGITTLNIGSHYSGNFPFNGHIKSLTYTPKRLSNAKLQELTK